MISKEQVEAITTHAHQWHMTTLERYGNKPNETQRTILRELVRMFAGMAAGQIVGRYPWPLATGLGKTTAVIAFHRTLEALHIEGVATATAATQVEALCRLYREMQKAGVPKEKIGLFHAKKFDTNDPYRYLRDDDYASEPATTGNEHRPYVLVTQERVKDIDKYSEYYTYRGKPRQLMIWDESLMASEYWKLAMYAFEGATASLYGLVRDYPDLKDMSEGFQQYTDLLKRELVIARERGKTRYVVLPQVPLDTIAKWTALAKSDEYRRLLHDGTMPCLGFFNQKIRVYPVKETRAGLVWYTPTIPGEDLIPSMVILDASYPIRELEQADATLRSVEEDVEAFASGRVSFYETKRYDNVTIHQWCRHSGRDAMKKDFYGKAPDKPQDAWLAERKAEQAVVRKAAKVAGTIPKDEAIIFFVFKPQQHSPKSYRQILEAKLHQAGVDLDGTVPVLEYDEAGKPTLVQKRRVCILTFGQETSLNDFSYAQNVFLVGLLHREEIDVMGQYVATCNGGEHEQINKRTATQLVQSEACHVIYQALSRGSCRVTEDGQARPMKAWVIHYSKEIRRILDVVMPGTKWVEDWPVEGEEKPDKPVKPLSPEALKLREYLEGLTAEEFPVRIKDVKTATGLNSLSAKVWHRVKREALEGTVFKIDTQLQAFVLERDVVHTPSL